MRRYVLVYIVLLTIVGLNVNAQRLVQIESASIVASHPFAIYDGAKGDYLKNNFQFLVKEKLLIETGYGVLNAYDVSFVTGVHAWHVSTFSLAAYLQPVNSKFIKFNIGAGIMRMRYHSYVTDALGNWYSPTPDIILQHVLNVYDWKTASEFSGNLFIRCYKNWYSGVQFSYVQILGELEPYTPEGFFTLGVQLKYYFNQN